MHEQEQIAELLILFLALPLQDVEPVGVLLLNRTTDELFVKIKQVSEDIPLDVAEVLASLAEHFQGESSRIGGSQVLADLQTNASMTFRVGDRKRLKVHNFAAALADSYTKYISPSDTAAGSKRKVKGTGEATVVAVGKASH